MYPLDFAHPEDDAEAVLTLFTGHLVWNVFLGQYATVLHVKVAFHKGSRLFCYRSAVYRDDGVSSGLKIQVGIGKGVSLLSFGDKILIIRRHGLLVSFSVHQQAGRVRCSG